MINPLGMMIVLSIVFSQFFDTVEGYAAYVLSGLIIWNFFAQTTSAAINSLVWGGDLFRRIYLPRSVFAISAVGTGIVNLLFSLVPLFAVMLVMRLPIRPTVLLAPLALLPMACFALGIGLLISTIGIYFPDIVEMYNILLMAWMYLTPIIYPLDLLPENVRAILVFNPMLYLVDFFRLPIYYGQFPSLTYWLAGFLVSVITLATGWFIFAIRSDEFAYRA
jgi:ABC-2 type transport system permease protein